MTLVQLKYVVAVATHGHFGRAASACGVTQPTLSMQIGKLERELGLLLFDRTKQPVRATDQGRLIVDQARQVLGEAERIPDLAREAGGELRGELTVGVLPTIGPYLLPRFVESLVDRYPDMRLVVEELRTPEIIMRLRQETLDAGLLATRSPGPELLERPLYAEPFIAYVAESHRLGAQKLIRPRDLSAADIWLISEEHCLHAQTLELCRDVAERQGAEARPVRFRSGNLETLKRLVERGSGMTLLPALCAGDLGEAAPGTRLIPFANPVPVRRIRLVRRRAHLKRKLVEAFVAALLESLPSGTRRSSGLLSIPTSSGGA